VRVGHGEAVNRAMEGTFPLTREEEEIPEGRQQRGEGSEELTNLR